MYAITERCSHVQAPRKMLLCHGRHALQLPACLASRASKNDHQARLPGFNGKRMIVQRHLHCRSSSSNSSRDGGGPDMQVSAGVSFASLPVSQQSISMAFQVLDKDDDGRISRSEAVRLVACYLALQQYRPAPAQRRPLTWDQALVGSITAASKLTGASWLGLAAACEAYVGAKVLGGLQAHPPRCSDLVWGALGMAAAVLVLGMLAAAAKVLPIVGRWHQQGVPLLLGSFGTLAILLFGKPEAEAVRLWPVIAGQLGAAAIVLTVLQVWGSNLVSRAAAMAATVTWMMWSDCIHPPGGALVLMAMDNAAIQQMSWLYLLWPSLLLSLGVLLPLSAATNWLRRTYQFDAPWSATGAATLHQKVREWQQQQAAKHAAVMRQWRALEIDRGLGGQQALHEELHSPMARLGRVLGPILQLISFPRLMQVMPQQQGHRQWRQHPLVRSANLDLGGLNLGRSISDASPAEEAAAAALDAAIRRRLLQDQERRLEDREHRRRLLGGSGQLPGWKGFEEKLNRLHQQRMQQHGQQAGSNKQQHGQQAGSNKQQHGGSMSGPGAHKDQHSQQQQPPPQQQQQPPLPPAEPVLSPRQRLEQHWDFRAQLAEEQQRRRPRSGSPMRQQENGLPGQQFGSGQSGRQAGGGGGRSGSSGPLDSFAPEDE